MKLTVCIASRGHPRDLITVIKSIDDRIADPAQTIISVALDDDDGSNPQAPDTRCTLVWSVAKREDSLGEKYNRAARNAPADYYVLGADDNIFATEKWDELLRFHAGFYGGEPGMVYFGRLDGTLPTQMAIPHHLVEAQGWLFPPFWPFWFHDTWTDEIAHMLGRIIWAPIHILEIGGRGMTRGLREVKFWAEFFETLRPVREEIAMRLSEKYNPPWLHLEIQQKIETYRLYFKSRTARLRDPSTAVSFEKRMSHDAEKSERYERIKSAALAVINEIKQEKAA